MKLNMKLTSTSMMALALVPTLYCACVLADYKPGPKIDARDLDIGGVKVGMDYDAVVSALVDYYDVPADSMKVTYKITANVEDKDKIPTSITLESNPTGGIRIGSPSSGWIITVYFVPKMHADDKYSVSVEAVEYEMAWTKENRESLRTSTLEKYGEPTIDQQSMGYQWCNKPNTQWANCESEAILTYSGSSLKLHDARPYRLIREDMDKVNSKKAKI